MKKINLFLLRALRASKGQLRRQAFNVVDTTVKLLTVVILVFVTFMKREDVAQTLEFMFDIDIPPLTATTTVTVEVALPEGEKLQVEFNPDQLAAILAAIEAGK